MTSNRRAVWFSEFFGIDRPQYELPFVDFDLTADVPLYIDPYAITKDPSDLASNCHNAIVSYFQCLLDAIRSGDTHQIARLIRGKLTEPVEIHLGVSKRARGGRGIGVDQERQIVDALANSEAAKTGVIQSIQELELHIPGIGPDKVSDLVANIILSYLAEYTEETCAEYGISSRPCAVSGFWNQDQLEWDGGYFNLPAYESHSYILVPKRFTRRDRDLINHRYFYRHYVLEVLQRQLLSANDSLVETLKNGKRRVTKKAIANDLRFPGTKEFISDFIVEHPTVVGLYREELHEKFAPTDPALHSGKADEDDPEIAEALAELEELSPGRKDAGKYHNTVFKLITFIFDFALVNFEKEFRMDQGRGRIDIIADNCSNGGLFTDLRNWLNAMSVPMECKNYASDLGNEEFNQLADRLGPKSSRFGILFCRSIDNYTGMLKHRTDRWLRYENLMLLYDDQMLRELVVLRLNRDFDGIQNNLRARIREVQFGGATQSSYS